VVVAMRQRVLPLVVLLVGRQPATAEGLLHLAMEVVRH
jgi:hypothetical protein